MSLTVQEQKDNAKNDNTKFNLSLNLVGKYDL